MRKIFLILILIIILPLLLCAEEKKIIKLGENDVKIIPHKEATDINDKSVIILDEGNAEHYGQDRIDMEMVIAQKELKYAQKLDVVKYKQELILKAQERIDLLNKIQMEMSK